MLFEGTRDFIAKFYAFGFANDSKIKEELDTKILPKYLPIFNKVSYTKSYASKSDANRSSYKYRIV